MNTDNLPKSAGIYAIISQHGKIYVGSSKNLRSRIKNHKNDLLKNKHCNPKLQRHVNKYGVHTLKVEILELAPIKNLLDREIYFIKLKRSCKRKHGFNINKKLDRPNAFINCKKITLKKGEEIKKFRSVTEAERELNINRNRIAEILNGKRNNFKDWRLCDNERTYKYSLRDEYGKIHQFDNSIEFGYKNGLDRKGVNLLLRGIWRHHRGWTCPKYEICLLNNKKDKFILNTTIKSFCLKHNLNSPNKLCQVINKKITHYKGWTIPDPLHPPGIRASHLAE